MKQSKREVKNIIRMFLSRSKKIWMRYKKNRAAVLGLLLVLFFSLIAFFAPILTNYAPLKILVGVPFTPPCSKHLMGTDDLGRDIFSGFIYGARTSLFVGVTAAISSAFIGILFGAISGYEGGKIDDVLMRITDAFLVIPSFFLALLLVAIFGANIWNVIIVISLLSWPGTARLVRADFMSLKQRQFVIAAKALGASDLDIIFCEILPNALISVIINTSLIVAQAILTEAGLSFLGISDPNLISWGAMLMNAREYLRFAWWMAFFPGIAILLTVLGYNLLGDGLNDLLNPRLKER